MCDASQKEKTIAGKITNFSDFMVSQAKDIFGKDSTIFNGLMKAYSGMVEGGPNQHGFNGAQRSEMDSAAITNSANQYRNIAGAVKSGQAAYGGGNTVTQSGTTVGQDLQVAQAAAEHTAEQLNQVDRADWETGRQNFFAGAEGETRLPGVFDNVSRVDSQAQSGLQSSLDEQKSLDAAAGWWKKPVMGLVTGGINVATGGLMGMASKAMKGSSSSSGGFPTTDSQVSA